MMEPRKYLPFSVLLLVTLAGSMSIETPVNGELNGSALFELSFSLPADYNRLQWLNSIRNTIVFVDRNGQPDYNPDYMGRCEMYNNGSLRLDRLTYADQGQYTVQLSAFVGSNQASYQLKVFGIITQDAVLSINSSTPGALVSGTYLSLECDAGDQNVTTYTFYRDGISVCLEPHVNCIGSQLHFQPITGSDRGSYVCKIENPISQKSSNTLQLTISEPVSGVTLTSNTSDLIWPEFDSVALHCSANGTNVIYSWSLQEAPLPTGPPYFLSQNDSVLTISPVSAKDNGTFTCTAQNTINNETSNGVNFTLASLVSEVVLTYNTSELLWVGQDSASLHCSALGNAIHFSWNLNGEPLSPNSQYLIKSEDAPPHSNLTISPVSKKDAGFFTCMAKNRLNNKTSNNVTLNLAWSPDGNISCSAQKINQNVQLGCLWSGGQPAANVTLIFKTTTDYGEDMVTSMKPLSDVTNGTQLSCHGNQLGGSSNCTLKFELPQSQGHNNDQVTIVEEGKPVKLEVSLVTFGLPATFSWYHYNPNQSPIQSARSSVTVQSTNFTSTLVISSATQDNNGKYQCEAENFIGKQSFFFNVNVTKAVSPPVSTGGLDGGAIAGIVIGVLAGITLIGILVFFIMRKKKRKRENHGVNQPEVQLGNADYAVVNKKKNRENGVAAETTITDLPQDESEYIQYAKLNLPNQVSVKVPDPTPQETEYSQVNVSTKR